MDNKLVEQNLVEKHQPLPYHNQLNRRPDKVRINWIIRTKIKEYSGFTWGAMRRVMETEVPQEGLLDISLVDIVELNTVRLFPDEYEDFMTEWRAHYYDDTWFYNLKK